MCTVLGTPSLGVVARSACSAAVSERSVPALVMTCTDVPALSAAPWAIVPAIVPSRCPGVLSTSVPEGGLDASPDGASGGPDGCVSALPGENLSKDRLVAAVSWESRRPIRSLRREIVLNTAMAMVSVAMSVAIPMISVRRSGSGCLTGPALARSRRRAPCGSSVGRGDRASSAGTRCRARQHWCARRTRSARRGSECAAY